MIKIYDQNYNIDNMWVMETTDGLINFRYISHISNEYIRLIKSYKNNPIGIYCVCQISIDLLLDYFHKYYYKTTFWHKP